MATAAPVARAQKGGGEAPAAPAGDKGVKPAAPAAPAAPGEKSPTMPAAGATTQIAQPAKPEAPTTGVSYTVKLHDLERRVNELKEQIFRSKARLSVMKETVLGGTIGGSRATITHRNEMGSTYTLIKFAYALDGNEIVARSDDSGHLGDTQEFEVFNGSIAPGKHDLSVVMVYQGNGYGVFSYLKGYKFTVNGSCPFNAGEGKQTTIKVVGFEKGNALTTDPKDRPAIDCRIATLADRPEAAPAAKK